jgi:hypothetical protein
MPHINKQAGYFIMTFILSDALHTHPHLISIIFSLSYPEKITASTSQTISALGFVTFPE